jgi:hypothetical protein
MIKIAKKITMILVVVAIFFVLPLVTSATSVVAVQSQSVSYDVSTTLIANIRGTDLTRFFFQPTDVINNNRVSYFRIRVYCEDQGTSIMVNNIVGDSCGKATRLEKQSIKDSSITLSNSSANTVGFYFKLKAYDSEGNWLHSEKKAFRWK